MLWDEILAVSGVRVIGFYEMGVHDRLPRRYLHLWLRWVAMRCICSLVLKRHAKTSQKTRCT